jgi:hypothetical protein
MDIFEEIEKELMGQIKIDELYYDYKNHNNINPSRESLII